MDIPASNPDPSGLGAAQPSRPYHQTDHLTHVCIDHSANAAAAAAQPRVQKIRIPAGDLDDASSVGSNDHILGKVQIKSALSSPRSSVSSSGAIRRGAWRAVGAAPSSSRSHALTFRSEQELSPSSSSHGHDEMEGDSPLSNSRPSLDHDLEHIPHGFNVTDHPAWNKLKSNPDITAPGTLSYLPAVVNSSKDSNSSPAQNQHSLSLDQPSKSVAIADGVNARDGTSLSIASPRSSTAQDGDKQELPTGAYDWANFIFAYSRGRWNPGLVPQPPGQSTAFPGSKVNIKNLPTSDPDPVASVTEERLAKRRPSLEYVVPPPQEAATLAQAIIPPIEPHSLPDSSVTDDDDKNTVASAPDNRERSGHSVDSLPQRTETMPPIANTRSTGKPAEVRVDNLHPDLFTALRGTSASMSSVSRLPHSKDPDTADGDKPVDGFEEAHAPQRAKTVPEGLPSRLSDKLLPSHNLFNTSDPPSASPVPRRENSDTAIDVAAPRKILTGELDRSGTSASIKAEPGTLQRPAVSQKISHLDLGPSPLSTPTPATSSTASRNAGSVSAAPANPEKLEGQLANIATREDDSTPSRPGPTPVQSSHRSDEHPPHVWQSAPEGLSAFAEAMARQASGSAANESSGVYGVDTPPDSGTVAGLRRAARRTSMERAEERATLDPAKIPTKASNVSHSASFPGSSPRSSISSGGPRDGVQPLSHLSSGRLSSSAATASTNSGPTVSVAHFVKGKPSGETRIDLRGTVTSSPAVAPRELEGKDPSNLPGEASPRDVSLAALASTRPRPPLPTTSTQRINAYLAAGRRAELFYRDHGYLPSILPPHEESRLLALSRYGPPKLAGDPNFERIAHLVKLVFNSKLVLITLVGKNEQIFQTEMGGGGEFTTASLQNIAGSRNCSFCSHAILQDSDEPIVIFDATKDWRFSGNPLVAGSPDIRFYAGSPLRTVDGYNIGSLCLIDDKPRSEFGPRQRHTLKEFARVVMREMELLRDKIQLSIRDRMQRSVELFTKKCLEMDSEENESESASNPQGSGGTHKVFHLAAQSMREALQVSGAVIFDLSHFELIDSYESDFVPSDLGTGTSSKIYFSNPLSKPDANSSTVDEPLTRRRNSNPTFDGTSGVETFNSPFGSPGADQQAKAKRVPPMNVLGSSETDPIPPERNEAVPLSHHVQVAEFLRLNRTGKFYPFAPPPFRSLLPHGVTSLLLVPIFGLNKQPFALLCAYITNSEKSHALDELQVSGLQYIRALGMIVLSAILKKDIMLADKAKSNFISNISHELRTPLHGILAAAELLAETKLNTTQGSYLETVEACGKSLLELVNHVLDFTKLSGSTRQGQKNAQTKTKCDMVKLIQEVCESSWIGQMAKQLENASSGIGSVYAPPSDNASSGTIAQARAKAARDSKVETVIDIAMRPDGWLVNCDTGGIRRVLMNLIGNSLKFTAAGFVHVSLREVQSSDTHIMIELAVTDTGRGISRAFLEEQLFHPFTQENPLGTGTGLGLSIVNSIVQSPSLNGKIDVWSTEGEGTEIRVTCELELCDEEDAEGPIYKPVINVHHQYSVALLGFSDARGDEDLRFALEGYFLNWWEFDIVPQNHPGKVKYGDVVLINDNLDLLRQLQSDLKDDLPPVVFLTASRGDSDITSACEEYHAAGGIARILFKPAGPAKLESVVDFCLQCFERKKAGDPPSSEETKPSTPLPSPSAASNVAIQMEQSDSYFARRPSRPDITNYPGHELGSFESNASLTPKAEGMPIADFGADGIRTNANDISEAPKRPELDAGSDRSRSYHMSPDPPTVSNSLIRRHSTEARMEVSTDNTSIGPKPSRPLLPARSITYHEPRLHKHVLMSPMAGPSPRKELDAESYFERAPTPSSPNTPGSTISLEGGDGAVLKSAVSSARGTSSINSQKRRMQILSVEDNAINRKVIAAFLAKMEVDYVEATNGEEGIRQFQAYPPNHFDVILMDLSMPVLDGISAIAAIRKIEAERNHASALDGGFGGGGSSSNSNHAKGGRASQGNVRFKLASKHRAKIFALTGRSTDEDKRKAFQTGADGFIVKPLSFKVLSSLLRMLTR